MNVMMKALSAAGLALAIFAIPAFARAEPHVLRYADGIDITTLNPFLSQSVANVGMSELTMAFLTRWGTGKPIAEIAAVVPTQANGGISKDGKTITWHLRHDVKWSDGEPFTSADVAFTVEAIKKPDTLILDRHDFEYISRVDTPDKYTAIFHLSRPYAPAIHVYFAAPGFPVVPKHLLEGVDINKAPYQSLPVGVGPFRYKTFVRGDHVEMEANPFYFKGQPKLKKIIYRLIPNTQTVLNSLLTGEIEYAPFFAFTDYNKVKGKEGIAAEVVEGGRPVWVVLNTQSPILSDVTVRKALRVGTDRASILQRAYLGGGVLTDSLLPAFAPEYDRSLGFAAFDPKAAGAMLDDAGWKLGADGFRSKDNQRLHLQLVGAAGSPIVDQALELLRAAWTPLGIEVETKRYDPGMFFAPASDGGVIYGGKFDAVFFSIGTMSADGIPAGFECATIPPNGNNYARLCNKQLDPILQKADRTYDPALLAPLVQQEQGMLNDLAPFIVLMARNQYFIHRDVVTGLHIEPYAAFQDFMSVDVTK